MSVRTAISWCDSTFNPWFGCTKVSPACDHCYAERLMDHRMHKVQWGPGQPRVRTSAANWRKPMQWNAQPFFECADCHWRGDSPRVAELAGGVDYPCCASCGGTELRSARRRVFCASLADVFDNEVDPEWRVDLFALIEATPNLDWLVLTKRIGNASSMMFLARGGHLPLLSNIWLGATICNQEEADRDIPKLLAVPARVRFLSIEPMLGPVDLRQLRGFHNGAVPQTHDCLTGHSSDTPWGYVRDKRPDPFGRGKVDWIIAGGESGPQARPFVLGHAKEIVRQCKAAGVAVHVKQLGARPVNREGVPHPISDRSGAILSEWPEELRVQEFPA